MVRNTAQTQKSRASAAARKQEPGADANYLRSMFRRNARRPLLTREQEAALGNLSRNGDEAARQTLVESNLRLVMSLAMRHAGPLLPVEDLFQEGVIGLMKAAERFDERKGYRFSTYATWWIWQSITRALDEKARAIRLPSYVSALSKKVSSTSERLSQTLGREPYPNEIADELGETEERVIELMQDRAEPASLEAPTGPDQIRLLDMVPDRDAESPDAVLARMIQHEDVSQVLDTLAPRERDVIEMRFGLSGWKPQTLNDVATRFHLSRERVRQIERSALDKLRVEGPRILGRAAEPAGERRARFAVRN